MNKICTTCKAPKDIDDFSNDRSDPTGKQSSCKECNKAYYMQHISEKRKRDFDNRNAFYKLTQKELLSLVTLNPPDNTILYADTGFPYPTNTDNSEYLRVSIRGHMVKVHRLVWFLTYNEWPDVIDHIDGNVQNNNIANLRNTNQRGNCANRSEHRKGNLVGASYNKAAKKWMSYTCDANKKRVYLGLHATEHAASLKACRYMLHNNLISRESLPTVFTDQELAK